MANIKSAIKRARQNIIRRSRNKSTLKSVRTAEKKFLKALSDNQNSTSETNIPSETKNKKDQTISSKELLRVYTSKIDKAAKKGIIKSKQASRKVSRLSKRLQAHL